MSGDLGAAVDEFVLWAPFNKVHQAELQAGPNEFLIKLVKRGDAMRFTLGLRSRSRNGAEVMETMGMAGRPVDDHWQEILGRLTDQHDVMDWVVDTADAVPGS